MSARRLERNEIGRLGSRIYDEHLKHALLDDCRGMFVAIDVETGDYEIDEESSTATERLWERRPDAQVYVERIGYPAAFHAYRLGVSFTK